MKNNHSVIPTSGSQQNPSDDNKNLIQSHQQHMLPQTQCKNRNQLNHAVAAHHHQGHHDGHQLIPHPHSDQQHQQQVQQNRQNDDQHLAPQQQQLIAHHNHHHHHHHQLMQQQQQQQQITGRRNTHHQKASKAEGHAVSATVCANCGTTTTPLWRRAPTGETICNACGLYLKARNAVRPPWLKRNTIKKPTPPSQSPILPAGTCPGDGHCDGTGGPSSCNGCPAFNQTQVNRQALICTNCGTNTTPLWRRDESGNTICNACGLYYKLHSVHRPVTMKRSVIKRRKRVALANGGSVNGVVAGNGNVHSGINGEGRANAHGHHHRGHTSDNEAHVTSRREDKLQGPPTPSSSGGSDRDYPTSEEEELPQVRRAPKRKLNFDERAIPKRHCNERSVPAIEDYIVAKKTGSEWNVHETRRSLSPVEPNPTQLPQVQIHRNGNNGRYMGTPDCPLPSVFNNGGANSVENCPQSISGSTSPTIYASSPVHPSAIAMSSQPTSSSINALLNPASPSPQLPPISSVGLPSSAVRSGNHNVSPSAQGSTVDPNIASVLQAHRQELQREVSHLSMLLNRTNAIIDGLDRAMASVNPNGSANTNDKHASGNAPLPSLAMSADANTSVGLTNMLYGQTSGLPTPPINVSNALQYCRN